MTSIHTYLNYLYNNEVSPDYINAIRSNALSLFERDLPIILSLGHISYMFDISYQVLLNIIHRKIDPYKIFSIKKYNGDKRYICVPNHDLSLIQRWIHDNILCSSYSLNMISIYATGFIPNSSHIYNASKHLNAEWILKIDISNFFESISERQVYYVFRNLGYPKLISFFLTRLCTRVIFSNKPMNYFNKQRWKSPNKWKIFNKNILGHLPQGAPSSPVLSNLVCSSLDKSIGDIANRDGLIYTRYADDLTFSGDYFNKSYISNLLYRISHILGHHGFQVNNHKVKFAKSGTRKIVTGIAIQDSVLRVPRIYKDKLKQELYFIQKFGLESHCNYIGYKNHFAYLLRLKGRIKYLKSIEPDIGNKLLNKFNSLFPHHVDI